MCFVFAFSFYPHQSQSRDWRLEQRAIFPFLNEEMCLHSNEVNYMQFTSNYDSFNNMTKGLGQTSQAFSRDELGIHCYSTPVPEVPTSRNPIHVVWVLAAWSSLMGASVVKASSTSALKQRCSTQLISNLLSCWPNIAQKNARNSHLFQTYLKHILNLLIKIPNEIYDYWTFGCYNTSAAFNISMRWMKKTTELFNKCILSHYPINPLS